jgi:ferredoxin
MRLLMTRKQLDAANDEITRLRIALEAVCFPHDAKTMYQDSLHPGEWSCDGCGELGEECPTQAIVHAALDAGGAP